MKIWVRLVAILLFWPLIGGPSLAAQDVTGAWTFNAELSTAPDFVTRTRIEGPLAGGGGGFTGEGRPNEQKRRRAEAVVRRLREAPPQLAIARDGGRFTFTEMNGRVWNVTTDGKKQLRLTGDGELQIKAWLEGTRLMVEEDLNGPTKLLYAYSTVTEGGATRLEVIVRANGAGGARAVEVRRIYDAASQ